VSHPPETEAPNLFVARQPILDRSGRLYGYELLFRSSFENVFRSDDPDRAAEETIGAGLIGFGLDSLVGDSLAFINVTRDVLLGETVRLLPPERVVLEILESVEPDPEVVEGCRELRSLGYRLALDDWEGMDDRRPLLPLVDLVKLDVLGIEGSRLDEVADLGRASGRPYLAERVEERDGWKRMMELGFQWFQGFYFCKPQIVAGRRLEGHATSRLQLLRAIADPDLDFRRMEGIIEQDAALSTTLLRYLNSAAFGWRHRVETIGHALQILGETTVRRWAIMATMVQLGQRQPAELVRNSLLRAHFMEELAAESAPPIRTYDAFLGGLLSSLDALTGLPMEEAVQTVTLPREVEAALRNRAGPITDLLQYVRALEQGRWDEAEGIAMAAGLRDAPIQELYASAAERARTVFGA